MQQEKSNLFLEPNMAALIRTLDFKSWFVEATDEFADFIVRAVLSFRQRTSKIPVYKVFCLNFPLQTPMQDARPAIRITIFFLCYGKELSL